MKTIATIILTVVLTCVQFVPFECPKDNSYSFAAPQSFNLLNVAQQQLNGLLPLEPRLRRFEPLQSSMVYICTGPESKRYHSNSNCHVLNKCSGSIEKVTVAKAKSMKRTPCKICYR